VSHDLKAKVNFLNAVLDHSEKLLQLISGLFIKTVNKQISRIFILAKGVSILKKKFIIS
jgi:hypothetical protein